VIRLPNIDRRITVSVLSMSKNILDRMKLVLRRSDQPMIALLLLVSLVAIGIYVAHQSAVRGGLVDIDKAEKRTAQYKIDINQATWPEIANIPGIGEGLARSIVQRRKENGPFESHDELATIPRLGPKKLETLKQFLLPIDEKFVSSTPPKSTDKEY
jgi:competence protein ComEA